MRRVDLLAIAATLAIVAACGHRAQKPASIDKVAAPIHLRLLGINDFHGAIEGEKIVVQTSGGTTAELRVGGAALLANYIARLRELDPSGTILLSAGDMWQGTLESNFFEGRPVVMLDNALGYDAAALGNHEFDYGPVGAKSLAIAGDPAAIRYGALLARRSEAKFPILSANAKPVDADAPAFDGWTIVEKKGVKIGIVGLSTIHTPTTTQPGNVLGLRFDPAAPALIAAAKEARAHGAEIVLATAHLGGKCEMRSLHSGGGIDFHADGEAACDPAEEIMSVLADVPPGTVDAMVAGHTHSFIAHVIHGTPVIESGANGAAIGRIDLELDARTHKVLDARIWPPISVCRDVLADDFSCTPGKHLAARPRVEPATFLGGPVELDPAIETMLAPFRQEVADIKSRILGTADRAIGTARGEPSEIGALVTDEMRDATRRFDDIPDADFAIQNSGGLRAGLPKGPISYSNVYQVLPFDNCLATFSATGDELEKLLENAVAHDHIFQTSGLLMEIAGTHVRLFDAAGKRLDPKKSYVVVWNDFLASGGDDTKGGLPVSTVQKIHDTHLLRDVVADGIAARKGPLNSAKDPLLDPKKPRLRRVAK